MKKLALFALPLLLAACNTTGSEQNNRPYTITIKSMGYKFEGSKITVTDADIQLFSSAGAPDVRSIDYTAVMYDSKGNIAGNEQSYIVPATGTLFGAAKGGYVCTGDNKGQPTCAPSSPDVSFTNTGPEVDSSC